MMVVLNEPNNRITAETFVEVDKIKQHFGGSAHTYKLGAQLQYKVGQTLLTKVHSNPVNVCLDLGCGPGLFSQELGSNSECLISLDLSLPMLKTNAQSSNKVQGNSHNLPLLNESVDLVFSSLMIQWCDFYEVLSQVYRILKPGGKAVISTLIKGSLTELEQAWTKIDNDNHVHCYLAMEELVEYTNKIKWQRIVIEQEKETFWFKDVISLAKELKHLGANHVESRKNKGLMTKSKWQKMESEYQNLFFEEDKNAIPASYQVVYIELIK